MVLPNYPLQGVSRSGALTETLPMSWFYERMHRQQSNLLQEISGGPVATATGAQ